MKEDWVIEMKNKLIHLKNSNVLLVDWSDGADWSLNLNLGYVNAVSRLKSTAYEVYLIINKLIENKYLKIELIKQLNSETRAINDIHCIGHSLGAHVCGFIGKMLINSKDADVSAIIGRISGLDPAGPCLENMDKTRRLSISDALYVDVIHTSSNFGLQMPLGHSDYYPNGGLKQDDCADSIEISLPIMWCDSRFASKNSTTTMREAKSLMCSHGIAHTYFTDSIVETRSDTCDFMAYKCNTFSNFQKGICRSCKVNYMGFHSAAESDIMLTSYYLYSKINHYCRQVVWSQQYQRI